MQHFLGGTKLVSALLIVAVLAGAGWLVAARRARPAVTAAAAPATFEAAPQSIGKGESASMAIRDTGYIYLVRAQAGDLWFQVSMDGGDSFGTPLRVNDVAGEVMSHPEATPRMVQRGGKPYVLWGAREANGPMKLHFARSTDYGASFQKAIAVDTAGPAEQSFYELALAPEGTLWAAWLDGRDKKDSPNGSSVYVARSRNSGASFEPSVRAATNVCPCCRPSLAFDGDTVYIGFRKVYPGEIRDIAVTSSQDGGATWSAPSRVATDNWRLDGCPHSGPSLAVLGHRLFIAWYAVHAAESSANAYLAFSDNQGQSFSPAETLSSGVVDANHPQLAVAGDRLVASFQARDATENHGWGLLHAYVRVINAQGGLSPMQSVATGGASVTYPYLAFELPGHIFLAWAETGASGESVDFMRGRLQPAVAR